MEKDTNKQAYQETKLIKNNFEKSNIEMEKEFWKSVKECLKAGDRKSVIEAINFVNNNKEEFTRKRNK